MRVVIEQIKITQFGKLKDFVLDLKDGLNVIYGKNESGKSTIQLFLKAMFYGMSSRKRADESIKERERAIPFGENRAIGSIKLLLDGKSIEIFRSFAKTAAGDKFEVCDAISGSVLKEYTQDNLSEKLFGLSAEAFERTLFIRQNKISVSGNCDELTGRLINLETTGDEGVSAELAYNKLEREKRNLKAKDKRSAKGKIDELSERADILKRERYELLNMLNQADLTQKRIAEIRQEISHTDENIKKLENLFNESIEYEKNAAKIERIKRIDEADKKIEELLNNSDFQRGKNLDDVAIQKAQTLEKQIFEEEIAKAPVTEFEEEEKSVLHSQTLVGAFFASAVILMIASVVLAIIKGAIFLTLAVISLLFSALGVKTIKNVKNNEVKIELLKQNAQSEISLKNEKIKELKAQLSEILRQYDAKDSGELLKIYTSYMGASEQINSLKKARDGFLGDDDLNELKAAVKNYEKPPEDATELEEKLSHLRHRQIELTAQLNSLESKMAYETKADKSPADIDTELLSIEDEIEFLNRRFKALDIAQKVIKEAEDIFRAETMPRLNEKTESIFKKLTGDLYNGIKVLSDYKMRIGKNDGFYDAEFLSLGAYEQLYLALRLAIVELMADGFPMFLDDILTSFDDKRTENAIDFLSTIKERQAILFTCHKMDKELADKKGAYTLNI